MQNIIQTLRALPKKELIGLILLLIALPISLILVQKRQELREKAYTLPAVTIVDEKGIPLPEKITDPNVYLLIRLPEGWELPPNEGPLYYNPFVKDVFAQIDIPQGQCFAQGTPTCTQASCEPGGVGNCTSCPEGYKWCYGGYCIGSCPVPAPNTPTLTPAPATQVCTPNSFDQQNCRRCSSDGTFLGEAGSDWGPNEGSSEWCSCAQKYASFEFYQERCAAKGGPTPSPTPTSTMPPLNTISAIATCSGPHDQYKSDHLDVNISHSIQPKNPKDAIWISITNQSNGLTGFVNITRGATQDNFVLHDSFGSLRVPNTIRFEPDGTQYIVEAWSAPYSEPSEPIPPLGNPVAKTSFNQVCRPTPRPTPQTFVLKEIVVENMDEDGSSEGHEPFHLNSNFRDYLNKPIYWKLNDLKPDQKEATRQVRVIFKGNQGEEYGSIAFVTLTSQTTQAGDGIPVEVIIDQDFTNPKEIENWIRDKLNSYVNDQLATYQIQRKFSFDNASIDNIQFNCEGVITNQEANKIRIFIPKEINYYSWAGTKEICLGSLSYKEDGEINNEVARNENVLLHELGHMLGLPDYYRQDVWSWDNKVINIGIDSSVRDVMWSTSRYEKLFDPNSREIVNRLNNPLPEKTTFWIFYSPKQVILQILNDQGLPLPDAKVEIFPTTIEWNTQSAYATAMIPNIVSLEKVTDNTGRVYLGDQENIFKHHAIYAIHGGSALIRITHPKTGERRYSALTLSYLNTLYFAYGQTETATISLPFSQLEKTPEPGRTKILQAFSQVSDKKQLSTEERLELQRHLFGELRASGELQSKKSRVTGLVQPTELKEETQPLNPLEPSQEDTGSTSIPIQKQQLTGDIDNNGKVDIFDYNRLVEHFGPKMPEGGSPADLNKDGKVDIFDYNVVVENFGKTK